ncbi:MAG TPA: DUF2442 domain-containing protein [Pirellulales bacterium]|jgi:hypothetical protein|nr:DUF2442 domain-containing protein [Pirellulales bacterium]
MLKDIVEVRPLEGHRLWLRFEDGVAGTIDLVRMVPFEGVFAPLADESHFRQVRVLPDTGTIGWPSGADLDPDVLYSHVTGEPIPLAKGQIE